MNYSHRYSHRPGGRPDWWPADEPWPPQRTRWRGRRFFRRIGCLAGSLIFTLLMTFTLVVVLVANALGLLQLSASLAWLVPLGGLILVLALTGLAFAGRGLRRLSLPLGELVDAYERLAQGDYSVRVAEKGPGEVRSLLRNFNLMASRLQSAAEQRQNFLSDVAHELRTPITVIQGNLEGMLDGLYPADEAHLRLVLDETGLLARLVEDLRTLSLAESGALRLNREPCDLPALVVETVSAFQPQADAQGVCFDLDLPAELPLLELDPVRMRQVISNLLANALRYTPHGGTIWLRCSNPSLLQGRVVQLEIRDSGRGISADDLPHIFDRFYKAADSGGMGLGLSIARTLVEAHNGTIRAESPSGLGAAFIIQLPFSE
jgi:two-component system sensor histidine kinase BaeS